MKLHFLVFAIMMVLVTSCTSTPGITIDDTTTTTTDDSASKKGKDSSTSIDFNSLASVPMPGNWVVTLYQEDAVVKTSKFAGYSFTFAGSNKVTATKSGVATIGKWGTGNDSGKKKLYLSISTVKPLSELTEDWIILEQTAKKLKLQHVSGGNGGTDLIVLEVK